MTFFNREIMCQLSLALLFCLLIAGSVSASPILPQPICKIEGLVGSFNRDNNSLDVIIKVLSKELILPSADIKECNYPAELSFATPYDPELKRGQKISVSLELKGGENDYFYEAKDFKILTK